MDIMDTVKNQYFTENEEITVDNVSAGTTSDGNEINKRISTIERVGNRLNLEQKNEIAKSLLLWLEKYDRQIIHDKITNELATVKEYCKDDKLMYFIASEKYLEEYNHRIFTNERFENLITLVQNERFIKRIRSYDKSLNFLQRLIGSSLFILKPQLPKNQNETEVHDSLYYLLLDLSEWINSTNFIDSFSTEYQFKIKQKFKAMKEEIWNCGNKLELCSLYRYIDDYPRARIFIEEVFSNEQEELYSKLAKWIEDESFDSGCKSWLDYYLKSTKYEEFENNQILPFLSDIEEAKKFILSQYQRDCELERIEDEEVLEELHRRVDEEFEKVICEIRNDRKERKNRNNYIENDYSNSYAQREMGYSDDDIDTIFDGDPDAYWNID